MSTTPRGGSALQNQSEHYPESFGGRVPKRIRMLRTVTVVWQLAMLQPDQDGFVERSEVYEATTNVYGAVSAYSRTGQPVGVKPDEFEVVEWY